MFKKMMSIVPVAVLSVTVGANVQASTITVQKGDTLWDLSRANNSTVETIQMANQLTGDLIHPGDVLTIPKEKQYSVKQGDTLWDIAREHQVSVSQLKEWNQLHTDLIQPDSNLVIFEGVKASNAVANDKKVNIVAKDNTPKVTVPSSSTVAPKESAQNAVAPSTNNAEPKETAPKVVAPTPSTTVPKESASKAEAPTSNNTEVKETAPKAETAEPKEKETTADAPAANAKEIIVEATAYTASCDGCSGITSTGIDLKANPNAKVISVDPSVIPLGSKVHVEGYGEAIAGDTGGAIKGNKIDVFVPTKQDAIDFGRKTLKVKVLD
ncbi:LysM peptidoglycan-binding domain-containing protein [Ureibacillus sp. NPDC094379]